MEPSTKLKLPSPQGVALAIMRACNSENVTTQQIAGLLSTDPALTGIVLERANAASAGGRPLVSTLDAVNRLGLKTVKNLCLAFSLIEHYAKGPCANFDYAAYWSKSILMAVAMREICAGNPVAPADELFVLGLLARIGCLGLATAYPERYSDLLGAKANDHQLLSRERSEFALTHLQMGATLMERWGIPDIFISAALAHETFPSAGIVHPERDVVLQQALHFSWKIAECIHGSGDDRRQVVPEIAMLADSFSLDREALQDLIDRIAMQWQALVKQLHLEGRSVESYEQIVQSADPLNPPTGDSKLKILVVDDDPITTKLITTWLRRATGHLIFSAQDGHAGQLAAIELKPHVVITDWLMPVMDGISLCKSLRSTDWGQKIYILMLTAADQENSLIEAFEAGVDDYLSKPLRFASFSARLKAAWRFVRVREAWENDHEHLRRLSADLALTNRRLQELAISDPLTGLSNRRAGVEAITKLWSAATRHERGFTLISLDIDFFKSINDRFGHLAGDLVLERVAKELKNQARHEDTVCRWGGEEFLIILPNLSESEGFLAAERLRKSISKLSIAYGGNDISVTASLGVLGWRAGMRDHDEMLQELDEVLYHAKRNGRNMTTVPAQLI